MLLPLGDSTVLGRSVRAALAVPDVVRLVLGVRAGDEDAVRDAVAPAARRPRGPAGAAAAPPGTPRSGRRCGRWPRTSRPRRGRRGRGPRRRPAAGRRRAVRGDARGRPRARRRAARRGAAGAARPRPAPGGRTAWSACRRRRPSAPYPCSRRTAAAAEDGYESTDTAACFERYADLPVVAVRGGAANLKVTFPEDVAVAERLVQARSALTARRGQRLQHPQVGLVGDPARLGRRLQRLDREPLGQRRRPARRSRSSVRRRARPPRRAAARPARRPGAASARSTVAPTPAVVQLLDGVGDRADADGDRGAARRRARRTRR